MVARSLEAITVVATSVGLLRTEVSLVVLPAVWADLRAAWEWVVVKVTMAAVIRVDPMVAAWADLRVVWEDTREVWEDTREVWVVAEVLVAGRRLRCSSLNAAHQTLF